MNENDPNYEFFFALSVLANLAQLGNFDMNLREVSNDQIMKDLERQDKMLDEQTNIYLKKIVEQNDLIIKQNDDIIRLLKER